MSYDAFVRCNCLTDGLAKPPPCPVLWDEEEGMYVPEPALDTDELYHKVHAWRAGACVHPRMKFAEEHLGNSSTLGALRAAITVIGEE